MSDLVNVTLDIGGVSYVLPAQLETTTDALNTAYNSAVSLLKQTFNTPANQWTNTPSTGDIANLQLAIDVLRQEALNGDGSGGVYTMGMLQNLSSLFQSLQLAGIDVNNMGSPTDAQTLQKFQGWGTLMQIGGDSSSIPPITSPVLNSLFTFAATNINRNIQAMIELNYVKVGNEILGTQLTRLQNALSVTKQAIDNLSTLQQLHNNIIVSARGPFSAVFNLTSSHGTASAYATAYTQAASSFFGQPIAPTSNVPAKFKPATGANEDYGTTGLEVASVPAGTYAPSTQAAIDIQTLANVPKNVGAGPLGFTFGVVSGTLSILPVSGGMQQFNLTYTNDTSTSSPGPQTTSFTLAAPTPEQLQILFGISTGLNPTQTAQFIFGPPGGYSAEFMERFGLTAVTVNPPIVNTPTTPANTSSTTIYLSPFGTSLSTYYNTASSLAANPTYVQLSDHYRGFADFFNLPGITTPGSTVFYEGPGGPGEYHNYTSGQDFFQRVFSFQAVPAGDNWIGYNSITNQWESKSAANVTAEVQKLITARDILIQNIATLSGTTPRIGSTAANPQGIEDPNSLLAKLRIVLSDMQGVFKTTAGGDVISTTNIRSALYAFNQWALDNYGQPTGSPNLSKAGAFQQNLTYAITAGQSLNDQQKESVRNFLYVFEEYYKSASAVLQSLTQIIQRMAQGISR